MRRFCSGAAILVYLTAPQLAAARQTAPEITVVLTDHHFRLSAPVEPGRLLWHVKNQGSEPHQTLVIRLPEGVSEYGEQLLCAMSEDEGRHYELGMIYRFTIE